jgi:hypothetical protein
VNLRVPAASSLLDLLLDARAWGASPPPDAGSGQVVENVTEDQFAQALNALEAGHIELVILEDGEEFLQIAGEGEGPYALQFGPGAPQEMLVVPKGVTRDSAGTAMSSFLRGDGEWREIGVWEPLPAPAAPKGGRRLGRIFGRPTE